MALPSFCCPFCHRTSYHPEDIAHQYCGACHVFVADVAGTLALREHLGMLEQSRQDGAPDALVGWALGEGYPYVCVLPDGRLAGLAPLALRQAQLWIGTQAGKDAVYTYGTLTHAYEALRAWVFTQSAQGEPVGWHRHQPSGRRRPDGDTAREYVAP